MEEQGTRWWADTEIHREIILVFLFLSSGLIVPLKSVICLSQKRVNDRFCTAAAPCRAGDMSLHTASYSSPQLCCGKGGRTPKVPTCPWRKELKRRAGDWEWQPRPTESSRRGQIRAGDGGRWHQPRFLPPLVRFPEKAKNVQVNHSGNSGNYCYLNSTTLHRNKGKIRQVLLSCKGGKEEKQQHRFQHRHLI